MVLDRIFVSIKIGDNLPYLDGMMIDYFDEIETGVDFYKALTPDCSQKFRFVQIDRRLKPKIIEMLPALGYSKILDPTGSPILDPVAYRVRGGILPIATLAGMEKKSETELRDQTLPYAPINGLSLNENNLKSAALYAVQTAIPDKASISDGPCSVGAGGAGTNYLTWALFGSDVVDLTGGKAIVATQCAATAETAQCLINKALGGGSITMTSGVNPAGNFGGGWLSTYNVATNAMSWFKLTCSSAGAGAKINLSKLNLKYIGANPSGFIMGIELLTATTNITSNLADCLFNANGSRIVCYRPNNANCVTKMFNCVAANGVGSATTYACGTLFNLIHSSSVFENLTMYGFTGGDSAHTNGFWNWTNSTIAAKNIACFGNAYDYTYDAAGTSGLGNAVASKCASSDNSGSEAGLRSLTAATEFTSLDITSANFLKLKPGVLSAGGVAPSIAANTYGIRGNVRPHGGVYAIGADEYRPMAFVPAGIF
jgi:hypothetical protein